MKEEVAGRGHESKAAGSAVRDEEQDEEMSVDEGHELGEEHQPG